MVDVIDTRQRSDAAQRSVAPLPRAAQRAAGGSMGDQFAAVLAAAQAGAPWALTAIWTEYAPAIAAFARARGSREPDDLASDAFVDLFERLPAFEGGEQELRSFVFSIAYRRVVDELRRRGRRGETVQWTADADRRLSASAEDAAITGLGEASALSLLDALPEDQRNVMTLRIVGDLTIEQTAEVVGKRVGAVKALQRRALDSLRKKVSSNPYPFGPVER